MDLDFERGFWRIGFCEDFGVLDFARILAYRILRWSILKDRWSIFGASMEHFERGLVRVLKGGFGEGFERELGGSGD